MSLVIEIGGIDNSGKTTLIGGIMPRLIKEGYYAAQAKKRIPLEEKFPSTLKKRIEWYRMAPASEIIDANLSSAIKRDEITRQANEDITLESRGYLTIYASMIAMNMNKQKTGFDKSKEVVDSLNQKYGFEPIEDAHYIISFGGDWQKISKEVKERENGRMSDDFVNYLKCFNESLGRMTDSSKSNIVKIDAYGSKGDIEDIIFEHISNHYV